jgi:MFS family permease
LRAYLINQTAHWFIVGLLFPVLILIILDKGLDLFQAGAILAVYSGTAVALELPTGGLSDSIGRKKVYILALSVNILAIISFLLASSFATVALAALLMGLGRALSSGSIDAWFVDEFKAAAPQGNLQEALAKANILIPVGLGIGSLIGGLLPMTLGKVINAQLGMTIFAANLFVVLVADILQLFLTQKLISERTWSNKKGGWKEGFRSVPSVISSSVTYGLKNRIILVLLMVNMAIGFGVAGLELLWQPRVSEIMGNDVQTIVFGVLAAAYFLITAVGSALSTPLCRWFNGNYGAVMAILLIALGGSTFVLAMQGDLILFAAFYLLIYLLAGMTNSPYGTMYNEHVPSEQRSTMLSFQSLVLQGGALCGSLVLGYVAGSSGIPLAWMVAAAVVAFSSIGFVYLGLTKTEKKDDTEVHPQSQPPASSQ